MPDSASLPLVDGRPHPALLQAMRDAGAFILSVQARGAIARTKSDNSPVTDADEGAEHILVDAIRALDPAACIIGEEGVSAGIMPDRSPSFWLLDPLDGTRDFIAGGSAWTVNAGLVVNGAPVMGMVLHPATGRLWVGAAGCGAALAAGDGRFLDVRVRAMAAPPRLVVSHSHLDPRTRAFIDAVPGARRLSAGSSIKHIMLADGQADAYPRYGPTMEWDTAAADAILRAAGGTTLGTDGLPYRYGKPGYANRPFLALADPASASLLPPFTD